VTVKEKTDLRPPNSPSPATETAAKPNAAKVGPYQFAPKVGDSWEKCLKAVEGYDNDMCTSWKEDIDTLLVFVSPNSFRYIPYLT
jgi:hypothetical protein